MSLSFPSFVGCKSLLKRLLRHDQANVSKKAEKILVLYAG